jgi:hypothetical protein
MCENILSGRSDDKLSRCHNSYKNKDLGKELVFAFSEGVGIQRAGLPR